MPKPNVFVSHRWDYNADYYSLIRKFDEYGFVHSDYSVPKHDPLDFSGAKQIEAALAEQVRQCNYFIVFCNLAIGNSYWCKYEVTQARKFGKPILCVRPWAYQGGIPSFILLADNQGGPVGFNIPTIMKKIQDKLNTGIPKTNLPEMFGLRQMLEGKEQRQISTSMTSGLAQSIRTRGVLEMAAGKSNSDHGESIPKTQVSLGALLLASNVRPKKPA